MTAVLNISYKTGASVLLHCISRSWIASCAIKLLIAYKILLQSVHILLFLVCQSGEFDFFKNSNLQFAGFSIEGACEDFLKQEMLSTTSGSPMVL